MNLKEKMTPMRWLMLIAALGMILLFVVTDFNISQTIPPEAKQEVDKISAQVHSDAGEIREYEKMYEENLQKILEKVSGVGQVSVMVNIDSTEEVVLGANVRSNQRNTDETDRQGGNRKITEITDDKQIVILRGNNSGESPVIIKRLKPEIRGVIVVAEGAANIRTHALLVDAVQRALNVGANKISILPMDARE